MRRYRQIAEILLRHGFGELVDLMELQPYLAFPRRLLRRIRPEEASPLGAPVRIRLAIEELGATFIKLGQVLSTRPDLLPPALVAELSKLQDTVPPEPWETIRPLLESELEGALNGALASIDPDPLAAASLAQVHAATLPDGSEVVVKIQRPSIQHTIETDLEILTGIAELLQDRTAVGKIYDLPAIVEEFAVTLRAELNFVREGQNADRFREMFAGERHLHIPKIYWDLTTRRVLVMERLRGIKIDNIEALDAARYDRSRIATRAAQMVLKEILLEGFFHADPHPGNFVVMEGEVIGAMDFGMVGYLSRESRADLTRLYLAATRLEEGRIVDLLIRMKATTGEVNRQELRQDIGRMLQKYYAMPLKAIHAREVLEDLRMLVFRHHLQLPSEYWLLGRTLAVMEGVGLQLDPDFDIFSFAKQHMRRLVIQLALGSRWGPELLNQADDWANLVGLLPHIGSQLLTQAEQGEFQITLKIKDIDSVIGRIDQSVNRITLSVLLAALIVGIALMVPAFHLEQRGALGNALVIGSFAGASLLGIWWIVSILRSGRK